MVDGRRPAKVALLRALVSTFLTSIVGALTYAALWLTARSDA
jgi:hypothetical protein